MSTKRMSGKAGRKARAPGELSTKEKILDAAITLFADRGYDCVSIRDIAGAVGIRESAIYRHYEGKEYILDAIIDSMIASFDTGPGNASMEALMEQHGPEGFVNYAVRATMERMKEPRLRKINRIICIELYRNEKVRDFFRHTFMEPSRQSWEQIFKLMMDRGYIGECNAAEIATELANYSVFLYFNGFVISYDEASYETQVDDMIADYARHVAFIFRTFTVNGTGKHKVKKRSVGHE